MAEYKTPGVYITEQNAFGTSVVEAETAIPAFIGFTEKALNGDKDLTNVPWKISSMNEFIQYFGEEPKLELKMEVSKIHKLTPDQANAGKSLPDETRQDSLFMYVDYSHEETEKLNLKDKDGNVEDNPSDVPFNYAFCISGKHPYSLFYQMQLFFANGGGTCYVVSAGLYSSAENLASKVDDALEALTKEREVTLIVVPEAAVSNNDCANIQQSMMKHCGEMKNRFAILDVPTGDKDKQLDERIEDFQNTVTNYFSYGAAYFPWLNTTVLSERDLNGKLFAWDESINTYKDKIGDEAFCKIIATFCSSKEKITLKKKEEGSEEDTEEITKNGHTFKYGEVKEEDIKDEKGNVIGKVTNLKSEDETQTFDVEWIIAPSAVADKNAMHLALYNGSPLYKQAIQGALKQLNLLPPSAAMAGIYTMVDHSRGVWKAPANVSLNYVDSPAEDLDDDEQANLNAPMNGKAVNVIRMFRGEGVKVWGARTLDGNSLDWRYINVRRTLLFLEESVKNAARAYVFEPNDAGTWINMKCMIENFLRSVWKRGGLAGSTPEEAFEVHVGLGDTMTGDDILEGIMRITVLVAVTHPAEFIEITFQQQMQKS